MVQEDHPKVEREVVMQEQSSGVQQGYHPGAQPPRVEQALPGAQRLSVERAQQEKNQGKKLGKQAKNRRRYRIFLLKKSPKNQEAVLFNQRATSLQSNREGGFFCWGLGGE